MNVHRSVARHLALALPDFEIRLADDADSFARPLCRIVAATGTSSTPHGNQYAIRRRTFSVTAFPVEGLNAESSYFEGLRIENLLVTAFAKGVTGSGWPMRLPLYNYAERGLYEPATDDDRTGYARVLDIDFNTNADEGTVYVGGTVRLEWTVNVARPTGPPITAVTWTPERVA